MAVYFYDVGDHPAGFVGFRAVTTRGKSDDLVQEYFSLSQYGYNRAYELAHQLDARWRVEAEAVKRLAMLEPRTSKFPGSIALGLRAGFRIDKKRNSIIPAFIVQIPGYGKGQRSFTTTCGYLKAYHAAVDTYAEIHDLTDDERSELIQRCPPPTLFTGPLWVRLLKSGKVLTKRELTEKLSLPEHLKERYCSKNNHEITPGRLT